MSLGAQPVAPGDVRDIIDRKMADFQHVSRGVRVKHLEPDPYFDAAMEDPDIRFAMETGFITELKQELRDPVVALPDDRVVFTCPSLVVRVLAPEPAEIHRAFVEGVFMRKLFRFFVPAAHEGGSDFEASQQVREIMQRHFAWQLVVTETLLGQAS